MSKKIIILRKAQLAFLDIFLAISVFFFLFVVAMFMWNDYVTDFTDRLTYEEAVIKAFHVSDIIVRSPGTPTAWEGDVSKESLKVIGLADTDRQLTHDKVKNFTSLEPNKVRALFDMMPYKYYFKITDLDGDVLEESGETVTGEEEVINLKRFVLYKGEEAIVELTIWK